MAQKISEIRTAEPASQVFGTDIGITTQGFPGTPVTRSPTELQRFDYIKTQMNAADPIAYTSATATYSLNINATNLRLDGSDLNTIQDIDITATPTFSRVFSTNTISINTTDTTVEINGSPQDVCLNIECASGFPLDVALSAYGVGESGGVSCLRANGSPASPTAVVNNDFMRYAQNFGHDGTTFRLSAYTAVKVDGTVSAGIVPSQFVWANTNAAGVFTEKMFLKPNGELALGISVPNAAAILHVNSTTQGVLFTPMTEAERDLIASPPEGLEIFNLTSHKKNFYNGTIWVESDDLPVFTTDAIPFGAPDGTLKEDPAHFTFNDSMDQLAVGAANTSVVINGEARNGSFLAVSNGVPEKWGLVAQSFGTTTSSVVTLTRARGSVAAPQDSNAGDVLGGICASGYDGTDYGMSAQIVAVASANHANDDTPAYWRFETTPSGADVPVDGMHFTENQQLTVSDTGTVSSDASAVLQADSTTRGFLPPRMTTAQKNAISTPAEGLMVFDTDTKQWEGYNGTSWVIIG